MSALMNSRQHLVIWLTAVGLSITAYPKTTAAEHLEAVTFAAEPGKLYLPLQEASQRLGWRPRKDRKGNGTLLNKVVFPPESFRSLPDGTVLAPLSALEKAGAEVASDGEPGPDVHHSKTDSRDPAQPITVRSRRHAFAVAPGAQSVEIDLKEQKLQARQGDRLVLETRISSGRRNSTPRGEFRAGPYKAMQHFSSKYNNAPMPWSVQVTGHIFIHGFSSVPDHPASHGCIRLPLGEDNPARFFFEWIEVGTPIRIR